MNIKKMIGIQLVAVIIIGGLLYILTDLIATDLRTERLVYEESIGTELVIKGDTLMIVDYSTFSGTFTLSNGTEVDRTIIYKLNKNVKRN